MTICSRCKRELTNKDSIKLGLGPCCAKKLGVKKEKELQHRSHKPLKPRTNVKRCFA